MYLPTHFEEHRLDLQHALIRAHPLGLLITAGPAGPIADPVPFLLDEVGARGTLRTHLARANPHLTELAQGPPSLVVFQGPQAYVTPSWYLTKQDTGKVVPTWNYMVVQVRGRPRVVDDPAWLRQQVDDLTRAMESARPQPWAVEDAPPSYVAGQIRGIVGVEIPIDSIAGKWKVSQNRSAADRAGVADGFAAAGQSELADEVARRGRGPS